MNAADVFKRRIALTQEHGSWVFLLSPFLIGTAAADRWTRDTVFLTAAVLGGFLLRHPLTLVVKTLSGRKRREDLVPALFWSGLYGLVSAGGALALILGGFGYLVSLVIPGLGVLIWYLILVSRREERGQIGLELVGSGVLALTAPAGYWVGTGEAAGAGWWLWGLTWFQSAASIVYAYLRLEQRKWASEPDLRVQIRAGTRAFAYSSFNLLAAGLFAALSLLPAWIFLPYLLQWLETSWGILNPAVGKRPAAIGTRQLVVSVLFTASFILAWHL